MSLEKYKQKRHFDKTPEPTGGNSSGNKLRFVVQKHHASHLHYDFRLELRGILKSWAVPKGPSMKAGEMRLAMLVEDHPWDYRDFEGVIPSGYGAGTVIVWDEGTYETTAIKEKDKKAQEHSITSQFWKGDIKFILHGHKIKGNFKITRAKEKGENAWYLLKLKDKYASTKDITVKNKSVLSKKTLEQVAANPGREWQSHKPARKSATAKKRPSPIVLKQGIKAAMPASLKPMLCTLVKEPFSKDGWLFEVKWDGYRIIAFKNKNKVSLRSRSGIDYSHRYTVVRDAIKQLEGNFVIDGEVVAFNKDGEVSFDAVQKANPDAPLAYYVFDIVWYEGKDVKQLPLIERKQILKTITGGNEMVKFSEHFDDGIALYEQAGQLGLEGIVAKSESGRYSPGKRGDEWLKIPVAKRQEFVIGGWAESSRGRSFRSLLFGAYNEEKQLEWIGRSGGGYKEKEMPGILKKLKALEIDESPFVNKILDTKGAVIHYVKPELVANFKFATWTTSGRIRKPATFLGFRNDKKPKDVVREVPLTVKEEEKIVESSTGKKAKTKATATKPSENSNWPQLDQIPVTSHDKIEIENCTIELINVEKEIWKGITKADLITYYNNVAPYILPQLRNRPLSLHIKPHGATTPGFYIKDMEGRQPDCADIFSTKRKHPKAGKRSVIDYLVCNNLPTLLYLINLGCIDVNPWTSTTGDYLHPDYIVIDLDPSDDDFKKVTRTAQAAKKVFDKLKLKVFPKTSGKTGMHLLIPCKGFTFPEARAIALNICKKIHAQLPEITTIENAISKRGDKLFIDYNQNDEADTIAAPYSARPAKLPTVSTPLQWKEVNSKLNPQDFTLKTIFKRLEEKGDLFKDIFDKKTAASNTKVLKKML